MALWMPAAPKEKLTGAELTERARNGAGSGHLNNTKPGLAACQLVLVVAASPGCYSR